MSVRQSAILLVLWSLHFSLLGMHRAHAREGVRVQIDSSQPSYLLGQPVVLDVKVTTTATDPVHFLEVFSLPSEIGVYLSDDGEHFRRWVEGINGILKAPRKTETLSRSTPKQYALRVLYEAQRSTHLAFEKPGRYWLRVRFPLAATDPPFDRTEIDSNTIRIDVVAPRDHDAEIWRKIQDDDFLAFLQTGGASKETIMRAAALLKTMPNTAYDAALRSALREYYEGYTIGAKQLDEHEAALLRSILGIETPTAQPFPEDKRLDQIITYHFIKRTPWEDVFKEITEQSSVPLEIDPALRIRTMSSVRVTEPLRHFMRNQAAYKAEWERKGDGYLLRYVDVPGEQKK